MEKIAIKQKLNTLEAEVRALRLAIRRPLDLAIRRCQLEEAETDLQARTAKVVQEAVWLSPEPSLIQAS